MFSSKYDYSGVELILYAAAIALGTLLETWSKHLAYILPISVSAYTRDRARSATSLKAESFLLTASASGSNAYVSAGLKSQRTVSFLDQPLFSGH
jgi:hypothetical protein